MPGPRYTIVAARPRDVPALPAIELAAAQLLRGQVPESILTDSTDEETLRRAQAAGRLWVALDGDEPVGFAHVEMLAPGLPHLEEIDVQPAHGRRGVGAALVRAVCEWTRRGGYAGITLTTFRDVAWNAPFYAKLGFVEVPTAALAPEVVAVVRHETEHGLDPERRLVMRWEAPVPEHVRRNRAQWDAWAQRYAESGAEQWARDEPAWGIWEIPESRASLLPDDLAGTDVIELGCGTAYVSAWLARRGARVVGIDGSQAQLATARSLQREHGLDFPLLHGNAEAVPYPDASFDLAISEYGACLWADPERWVPEAARLLRPGGRLVFLVNSFLMALCTPAEDGVAATDRMLRPAFGLRRLEWPGDDGVEFHLMHGDWIRLLRRSGFEVEDLIELRPGADATTRFPFVTLEWARQWPSEEVWKARKRA
jgi:SAM-dependent methyltransferase/GNAT superfamily N-acetyltransferase